MRSLCALLPLVHVSCISTLFCVYTVSDTIATCMCESCVVSVLCVDPSASSTPLGLLAIDCENMFESQLLYVPRVEYKITDGSCLLIRRHGRLLGLTISLSIMKQCWVLRVKIFMSHDCTPSRDHPLPVLFGVHTTSPLSQAFTKLVFVKSSLWHHQLVRRRMRLC